jgi:anti-sigma factor RsiW
MSKHERPQDHGRPPKGASSSGAPHPPGHIIQAYFDQDLSVEEAAVVQQHCRDCPDCRQALAELGAVKEWLAADRPDEVPDPVWPALRTRLQREAGRRIGPVFALGTAAACAAGIVLGLLVGAPASVGTTQGPSDSRDTEETAAVTWSSVAHLWSSGASASLLDIYAQAYAQERSATP